MESRSETIQKLLALLPVQQRPQAAAVLAHNDAQSQQLLADLMAGEHSARRTRAVLLAASGAMMVFATSVSLFSPPIPWSMWLLGAGGMALLVFSTRTSLPTHLERAALETVVVDSNKHSLGALLEGVQLYPLPFALYQQSKQALVHLLQNLTAEDGALLTPAHRSQLYQHLNYVHRDNDLELRLATLTALQNVGDRHSLGTIYRLATGEAVTSTAQTVRQAAQDGLDTMAFRIHFGSVTLLPEYVDSLLRQFQAEEIDPQVYATGMLALRQLLPQLTNYNYRSVLSLQQRDHLYQLLQLTLISHLALITPERYGDSEMQLEIVRTAHRMRDTQALPALRKIAFFRKSMAVPDELRTLGRETHAMLEAMVAREKESKTLLRGAFSPDAEGGNLLRASAPEPSDTDPTELLRSSAAQTAKEPI